MTKKTGRGGGSGKGKPKGYKAPQTLEREAARTYLRTRVIESLQPMLDAQIENAQGCSQFVYRDAQGRFKVIDDPDELRACIAMGKAIRIFTRLPSTPAFTDLMNRTFDKPPEHVSVTGPENGPVQFKWQA
jgi:hypothetical protein